MIATGIPPGLLLAFVFLTGAAVGSFLNVCISRWPLNLSVIRPRSRCPRCERSITWYENLPILSWIALRGRCRGCRLPISIQYPAVELGIALLWVAVFAAFPSDWFLGLRIAVFSTVLVGIAVTDLKHYLIPDGFTVFGLIWLFTTSLAAAMTGDPGMFATPYDSLIGACVGAGAISIIGWLGEVALSKEAMGFGDVTLMAVVGAAVGPQRALLTIFVAAGVGALVFLLIVAPIVWLRRRGAAGGPPGLPLVPFGVFLAPAALGTLLKGDVAIAWYLSRLGLP
jgi:leader peptidase (prepilin peptidase) / N-methyltransferase